MASSICQVTSWRRTTMQDDTSAQNELTGTSHFDAVAYRLALRLREEKGRRGRAGRAGGELLGALMADGGASSDEQRPMAAAERAPGEQRPMAAEERDPGRVNRVGDDGRDAAPWASVPAPPRPARDSSARPAQSSAASGPCLPRSSSGSSTGLDGGPWMEQKEDN